MNQEQIRQNIQEEAHRLGFDLFGITTPEKITDINFYNQWLDNGFAGEMDYLKRNLEKRENPRLLLPGTKSIICLGMNYHQKIAFKDFKIAKYALGDDYHTFLKEQLHQLFLFIKNIYPHLEGREYTDTAPILERSLAKRSGLGWIGKNSMLINPLKGSYFLLGELFLNIDLEYNEKPFKNYCGNCTRCIDACPTSAIVAPGELNSNLCIAYLTIEAKTEIHPNLAAKMNEYIFGCDICQDVCPWNQKFAEESSIDQTKPREWINNKSIIELLEMEQAEFSQNFKNSPVKRSKLKGLIRNVIAMISKSENADYIPVLEKIRNKHGDIVNIQIESTIKNLKSFSQK